ncbi:orotate phosphoribosyltransferase [Gammaproteobacteria bacterium]|jgi:orotate phosphoribosyltransferase|nr:orotate phosphoribosyltransferase [Gammaproteobacteria bacterium]MDC1013387.1 orotate phosphoribosyltransferase [Gammaproteobacteria bacterium]
MPELKDFQRTFIELALQSHALEFGKFILKSGRSSPYFFNAAKMLNGCDLFKLANCYVDAIEDSSMEFDCLYGPAYKGIFLASIVATVFSQKGNPCPLAFNRKEVKDHGEGGNIIGANPVGNVMIIDDVLSAGTAARESIKILEDLNAIPKIFLVGLDRQEKGTSNTSAKVELEKDFGIHVSSIVNLETLIAFSHSNEDFYSFAFELEQYRNNWGA